MHSNFFKRFITPYGMLIAVFFLVLAYAFSLSRIMLAMSHQATVILAVGIAIVIFVAGFAFEKLTNLKQAHLAALGIIVFLGLIGAGTIASYNIPDHHDEMTHEQTE